MFCLFVKWFLLNILKSYWYVLVYYQLFTDWIELLWKTLLMSLIIGQYFPIIFTLHVIKKSFSETFRETNLFFFLKITYQSGSNSNRWWFEVSLTHGLFRSYGQGVEKSQGWCETSSEWHLEVTVPWLEGVRREFTGA